MKAVAFVFLFSIKHVYDSLLKVSHPSVYQVSFPWDKFPTKLDHLKHLSYTGKSVMKF